MLAQIPEIDKGTEVKAEVVKGGFIWGVKFKLPKPAEADGYIIQMIRQFEKGQINKLAKSADGSMKVAETNAAREGVYWEAWEVKKGEITPRQEQTIAAFAFELTGGTLTNSKYHAPMNDIFFKNYGAGSVGSYNIKGLAGFYQTALPLDFIIGHPDTGAGALRSTTIEPSFWTVRAGLFREVTLTFDFLNNSSHLGNIRPNPPKAEKYDHRATLAAWGF